MTRIAGKVQPSPWTGARIVLATVLVMLSQDVGKSVEQGKEPKKNAPTTVDFSATNLIGALITFERGIPTDKLLAQMDRGKKQDLKGKVTVPAGHEALLFLMADGPRGVAPDLSVLDKFQADDLAMLVIQAGRVSPKEIERLARHKALRVLAIGPLSTVSEQDLAPLKKLTWLEELSLTGEAVTIKDLAILKELPGAKGGLRSLELTNSATDDEGLRRVEQHKNLRELNLGGTKVTDAGLIHLSGLTELRILRLGATKVSGSGLRHLSKLKNLKHMGLTKTPLTDEGLSEIRALISLEELSLRSTQITDAGLQDVGALKQLRRLNLDLSMVRGHSFKHLADLDRLEELTASTTPVVDESLKHLREMDKLRYLDISHTAITDRGLMYLSEVKRLRDLNVEGTKVTKEGVRQFQEKRPDVKVYTMFPPTD
jgi:tartrate dehydratase beta subunit/fumarate hydratase class I family protein